MSEKELGKSFKKELKTDKNKTYLATFTLGDSLEIEASQINDLNTKSFSNKFSFQDIITNKYFLQFDSLNEIFDELVEIIKKDNISSEENENTFKIKVPLPTHKNKEIIFELKMQNKNESEKINELTQLIVKQNKEITDLKNEVTQLKNENTQIKNEVNDLKEKLNILWKEKEEKEERKKIEYSRIIKEDEYKQLKEWIAPSKKIKGELLYRLSENGDNFATFHELCDNKGPTLTLFHVDDENKVGIYTPLSWETREKGFFKEDKETFIFNLNKNKKYESKGKNSIYCASSSGPNVPCFGTDHTMKSIVIGSKFDTCFSGTSDFLPRKEYEDKQYNLLEAEIYKIIIE